MPRVPTATDGPLGTVKTVGGASPTFSGMSGPTNYGGAALGRGLTVMAAELERAEREAQANRNKSLMLQAQRQAKGWMLQESARYRDPRSGALGSNADKDWVNAQAESFNKMAASMFEGQAFNGLDEAGTVAVQAMLQEVGFRHYAAVLDHHNTQMEVAVKAERTANLALLQNEIIDSPSLFTENMNVAAGYLAEIAQESGLDDEVMLRAGIQSWMSTAVQKAVENMVNAEQPERARAFLEQAKTHKVKGLGDVEMNADTRQDLENFIMRGETRQRGQAIAEQLQGLSPRAASQRINAMDIPQSWKDEAISRQKSMWSANKAAYNQGLKENLLNVGRAIANGESVNEQQWDLLTATQRNTMVSAKLALERNKNALAGYIPPGDTGAEAAKFLSMSPDELRALDDDYVYGHIQQVLGSDRFRQEFEPDRRAALKAGKKEEKERAAALAAARQENIDSDSQLQVDRFNEDLNDTIEANKDLANDKIKAAQFRLRAKRYMRQIQDATGDANAPITNEQRNWAINEALKDGYLHSTDPLDIETGPDGKAQIPDQPELTEMLQNSSVPEEYWSSMDVLAKHFTGSAELSDDETRNFLNWWDTMEVPEADWVNIHQQAVNDPRSGITFDTPNEQVDAYIDHKYREILYKQAQREGGLSGVNPALYRGQTKVKTSEEAKAEAKRIARQRGSAAAKSANPRTFFETLTD